MRELTYFPLLESFPKTSGYGYRIDPITGAVGAFHRGVDYGAPDGAPVIAPYAGQVTTGYESAGAGNWLWVDDGNGNLFKSFHHSGFAVTGGWVEAGRELAWVDSTGASTGSHAHLELWEWGINIDPTGYLDRAPLKGGNPKPPPEDEMTEADWNQMRSMLNNFIVGKLAMHSTPSILMQDTQCQFTVVMTDAGPRRWIMGSGEEVTMAQRIGLLAPQKPMNPPEPCPQALDVKTLSQGERDVLYGYPLLSDG
jgi:hypothetical protein